MEPSYLRKSILFFGLLLLLQVGWYASTAVPLLFAHLPVKTAQEQMPTGQSPSRAQACDAGSATRQATKVMNDAFGSLGTRGDDMYWARLSSRRGLRKRSLGNAWKVLRDGFDATQKSCSSRK